MRFCVLEVIFIIVEILLFEIIQTIIQIGHKPYVEYKNANHAVVSVFQLCRTGKGDYAEYSFVKKDGKWKYSINKDDIWILAIIMIVILCGMLVSFCLNGMLPYSTGIKLFVTIFLAVGLVFVYFPLKAYFVLKKA